MGNKRKYKDETYVSFFCSGRQEMCENEGKRALRENYECKEQESLILCEKYPSVMREGRILGRGWEVGRVGFCKGGVRTDQQYLIIKKRRLASCKSTLLPPKNNYFLVVVFYLLPINKALTIALFCVYSMLFFKA